MKNHTPHVLLNSIIILFVLMMCNPAGAQFIYFSVVGAQGGTFDGEVTQAGLEGKFQAMKYEYEVMIPQQAASGRAGLGGKRVHGPVKLTRKMGKGSPLFFSALLVNDALTVEIDFLEASRSGKTLFTHKVTLNNAKVVGIKHVTEPVGSRGVMFVLEELSFMFGEILTESFPSGQSATDNLQQGARR